MQWITITADLINEGLTATEATALLNARSTADPVPGLLLGLAARIRQCVLSGGRSRLQGGQLDIPAALRLEAVAILRYKVLTRLALTISEDRRAEANAAEARLDAIANGTTPLADDAVQQVPTYHGRPHRWNNPAAGGIMPHR